MARAFRLASLLRVRRLEEDRAAGVLAAANARRADAAARRRQAETALTFGGLPQHADELHWQAAVASRAALGGLLAESVAASMQASDAAGVAEQAWSAARTRAVVLEKLEVRHDLAQQVEELRLEQLVLDEVATRNAILRARAGSGATLPPDRGSVR
jgi:flagellar FliJ protein